MAVDIYVYLGAMRGGRMELGYVQFATHKGLRQALNTEAITCDLIVKVEPSDKEFLMGWNSSCPGEIPRDVRRMRLVPSAKVVKKEKGSESGLELQVYRSEEEVGRNETPWLLIEGKKKESEGEGKPIYVGEGCVEEERRQQK